MDLKELGKNVDMEEDEFREIVELFITSTQTDLNRLQSALSKGSVKEVAIAAHSIKGSAGMIGLMEIYEVAKRVETKAHEESVEGAEAAIQEIGKELNLVAKVLHESPSVSQCHSEVKPKNLTQEDIDPIRFFTSFRMTNLRL